MKTLKQFQPKLLAAAILIGLCTVSSSAFAARPPDAGNGGGGGGGSEPPDLGDIVVLLRDADGLPIPTTGDNTTGLCQQPLAAPGVDLPAIAPYAECKAAFLPTNTCVIPVDPATCAVAVGYETYTQEVDFGRTSVARSPDSVLDQALEEATARLATAQCKSLDPAGRLVTTSEIDGVVTSAAIDSPLENLAIYRQLLLTGYLGAEANPIVLPPGANVLTTAARGLGAAADKTGKVTVDQVVYLNQILGLTDESVQTFVPKKCINVREEVQGTVQLVEKCVLDFGPYTYNRTSNFAALPSPPYIPASDPKAGWFEYLGLYSSTPLLFQIVQGPILGTVFGTDVGFLGGKVGGFTQAADDTREVIEFTHDRPLPLGYETPVPLCDVPDNSVIYDVSISGDSGLQVPVRMVIGTEGREVIVTVANAGPDTATGTITVVGIATNGTTVFNESEPFNLAAGASHSRTWLFTLDFATTITWTATATPDCATCDLNTANNSVTETTTVTGKGGGQGGGGGGGNNNPK